MSYCQKLDLRLSHQRTVTHLCVSVERAGMGGGEEGGKRKEREGNVRRRVGGREREVSK